MKHNIPNILLVNPWIHDFAAYDFWAKPMGLLMMASMLEQHGIAVSYIDCLDRFHPETPNMPKEEKQGFPKYGKGRYLKTRIPKPKGLEDIPRYFSRYGIQPDGFRQDLLNIPKPDMVLVTSLMTYWYPGVQEAIRIINEIYPNTPVILGGIYARLCYDHAVKYSGADEVVKQVGEASVFELLKKYTGFSVSLKFDANNLDTFPYPAFYLQRKIPYVPMLTSRGCPFSCAYCASHFLDPTQIRRTPSLVIKEIRYWHEQYGVNDFVFYDDALLVDTKNHAIPLFEGILELGLSVRFHTPNAVHIREISEKTAQLMYQAGFKTLRLGLETTAFDNRNNLDKKVKSSDEFMRAVSYLKAAGFEKNDIGAYLLAGLPGQSTDSIEESVRTVIKSGIMPVLAYYSPIPHTALWKKAVAASRYDLASDPIFTNNSIFPCSHEKFSWHIISELKRFL